jgi:hypothetical protein
MITTILILLCLALFLSLYFGAGPVVRPIVIFIRGESESYIDNYKRVDRVSGLCIRQRTRV